MIPKVRTTKPRLVMSLPSAEESAHYWLGAFKATLRMIAEEGDEHSAALAKHALQWYEDGPLGSRGQT